MNMVAFSIPPLPPRLPVFLLVAPCPNHAWQQLWLSLSKSSLLCLAAHSSCLHLSQVTTNTCLHPVCILFFTSLLDCPLLRMVDPRYLNASTFATFVLCNFTVTPALSNSHSCILTFVPLVSSVYHHVSRLFYTCSLFFYRSQCHLQISGIPWPCATRTKMSTFNPKQITPGKQISVGEELAKMGQWLLAIFPCEGKKISNLHVYLLANSIRYK